MDLKELFISMHLLKYQFKYSAETIENMIPWEFQIELDLIHQALIKEQKANDLAKAQ